MCDCEGRDSWGVWFAGHFRPTPTPSGPRARATPGANRPRQRKLDEELSAARRSRELCIPLRGRLVFEGGITCFFGPPPFVRNKKEITSQKYVKAANRGLKDKSVCSDKLDIASGSKEIRSTEAMDFRNYRDSSSTTICTFTGNVTSSAPGRRVTVMVSRSASTLSQSAACPSNAARLPPYRSVRLPRRFT